MAPVIASTLRKTRSTGPLSPADKGGNDEAQAQQQQLLPSSVEIAPPPVEEPIHSPSSSGSAPTSPSPPSRRETTSTGLSLTARQLVLPIVPSGPATSDAIEPLSGRPETVTLHTGGSDVTSRAQPKLSSNSLQLPSQTIVNEKSSPNPGAAPPSSSIAAEPAAPKAPKTPSAAFVKKQALEDEIAHLKESLRASEHDNRVLVSANVILKKRLDEYMDAHSNIVALKAEEVSAAKETLETCREQIGALKDLKEVDKESRERSMEREVALRLEIEVGKKEREELEKQAEVLKIEASLALDRRLLREEEEEDEDRGGGWNMVGRNGKVARAPASASLPRRQPLELVDAMEEGRRLAKLNNVVVFELVAPQNASKDELLKLVNFPDAPVPSSITKPTHVSAPITLTFESSNSKHLFLGLNKSRPLEERLKCRYDETAQQSQTRRRIVAKKVRMVKEGKVVVVRGGRLFEVGEGGIEKEVETRDA
ncbi:hypothetical protein BDY24DRAFT_372569 [Mrakia frigida]|uniref:uncharacterized protein n=1 Tax=Mrakia frigida TaxID=29902 RepID=UPI003FCC19D7